MKIDSIIFDLDGTLWDSTKAVVKAWHNVLRTYKKIIEPVTMEQLKGIMGLQIEEIGRKLFPYLREAEQLELLELCCEEERKVILQQGGILYPSLESTLETLSKKYPLFIVSNCQCGYIEAFLEYHKLGKYFKGFECAGNTGLSKGGNIKKIIERNDLKASIYVGDTQGDCDAAKVAGIPFVFAGYGFGKVSAYDFTLNKLSDIEKLF